LSCKLQLRPESGRTTCHFTKCSRANSAPWLPYSSPHRSRRLAEVEDLHGRYKRVVEQNRALYNEVQDLKGSIRVFCRIRCGVWGMGSDAPWVWKSGRAWMRGQGVRMNLKGLQTAAHMYRMSRERSSTPDPSIHPQAPGHDG